ncbi:transcriptional regulator, TetR family [Paenibacillaceae bacterium GAS479]|nr:transcriptional regulator, TetR family [Paenibacillaceae bacterium GAS479]
MRARILRAAKSLFASQGFDKTTIRQICEAADANIALVSYHFGGKEGVFIAIFDTYFPEDMIREPSPTQRADIHLFLFIQEMERFRFRDQELGTILRQEVSLQSPRREIIHRRQNRTWTYLEQVLKQGSEQGLFHFRSLDRTMMILIGTLLSIPSIWTRSDNVSELDQHEQERIIEDIQNFIFRALQCPIPTEIDVN